MPALLTQRDGVDLALDNDSGVFTSEQVNGLVDLHVCHLQRRLILLVFLSRRISAGSRLSGAAYSQ